MEIISSYFEYKYYGQNSAYMTFKSAVTKVITQPYSDSDTFIYEAVRRLWQSQCKEYEGTRRGLTQSAPWLTAN